MTGGSLHDVVIVGAGPGGSTAATLLARAGHDVVVLEREQFPRFHVGESLLPGGMAILDRLGVVPRPEGFLHKRGAVFVDERDGLQQAFDFADAMPGCPEHAWHVDRAEFDTLLRDRAVDAGADVRHGETVVDVDLSPERVTVSTGAGTLAGRFLVDASGQDHLLGRLHGTTRPYDRFGVTALYSRFDGLGDEALEEIGPGAEIRILLRDDGWGWMIPLTGRRLSVGMVARHRLGPDDLDTGLLAEPLARRWTAGARRGATGVVRNFSYRNTAPRGRRYAAIGDAAAFLDPIFSSGVALAMRGAERLADHLGPALAAGREAELNEGEEDAGMDRAYRTFAALIDRFYGPRFARTMFLADPSGLPLRAGVMSVLAGDVWRDDNPFQEQLLAARRRGVRKAAP